MTEGAGVEGWRRAARRGVRWLVEQVREDGSYGPEVPDLASYYKSPWLMLLAGENHRAYELLGHIERRYLRPNGDFMIADGVKSENEVLGEYWPYTNTWIAMASQKLGRFDLARKAWGYVRTFYHPEFGAFCLRTPHGQGDDEVEGFITAHLGLASLYFGEIERARAAGEFLCRLLAMQPEPEECLYLRMDAGGQLLTEFAPEAEALGVVQRSLPEQLYFLLGYPMAFLSKLYDAVGEQKYLDAARRLLRFARSCHPSIYRFHFAHKVGWAASLLARQTGDEEAAETARRIADYLVDLQEKDGGWLSHEPAHTAYDQSAEIATWLLEISAELVRLGGVTNFRRAALGSS